MTGNGVTNYLSPAGKLDRSAFGDRGKQLYDAADNHNSHDFQNYGDSSASPQDVRRVLNESHKPANSPAPPADGSAPSQHSRVEFQQRRSDRQLRAMAVRSGWSGC